MPNCAFCLSLMFCEVILLSCGRNLSLAIPTTTCTTGPADTHSSSQDREILCEKRCTNRLLILAGKRFFVQLTKEVLFFLGMQEFGVYCVLSKSKTWGFPQGAVYFYQLPYLGQANKKL